MVPTFYIQSSFDKNLKADLFFTISNSGINYCIINEDQQCAELASYHFQPGISEDDLLRNFNDIIAENSILQQHFNKINIVFANAVASPVPNEFMNANASDKLLELVYGNISGNNVRSDFLYQQNLHVVYAVPEKLISEISSRFVTANYSHLYSLLPQLISDNETRLFCIFNTTEFTAMLYKQGKLQLIRSYTYKTPEDVVYHLLSICKNFDTNGTEVVLSMFGMIEKTSNLYNEVYKYFLNIELGVLPDRYTYPEDLNEYPHHYFAHLFLLAACV